MTAPTLTKNLFCTIGAVAASMIFMAAAAAPAHAAAPVARVTVADLDLSNDAGLRTFAQRVEAAAETVCGNAGPSLREQRAQRRCIETTIDDALMLAPTRA